MSTAERDRRIIQLRNEGMSWRKIAAQPGIGVCWMRVRQIYKEHYEQMSQARDLRVRPPRLDSPVTALPVTNKKTKSWLVEFSKHGIGYGNNVPVHTIGDLLQYTWQELVLRDGFGRKTLADIEQTLARYGWQLARNCVECGRLFRPKTK